MTRIEELKKQIEELDKQRLELQHELEFEKKKIEYPFEYTATYWRLNSEGTVLPDSWHNCDYDKNCFKLGNAFNTEQEALKELDRRILLTRFRQFRDKCNGDWKPESDEVKYYIFLKHKNFSVSSNMMWEFFNLFGYFKNREDAERAIELFGDEIKRLYLEE